ncbi:50S ribosomal protein L29 [filamentous cyanobacterium CCP1]|jgi:large subunit ribosomal protein L29|nr:50S ribosomal protein L29 [filamentous cyanobacterium CCP2]PSB67574.1 50S ribosomal protein L29 [filamentous cyanobacterium CCP1]
MPLPKIEEVRDLSDQELNEQIIATKRDLFQLRFQKATRQLEKPHQFKHLRHRLAQLMTVERERQLTAVKATPSAESNQPEESAAEE